MAFNFPPSPSNGDTYTANGFTYEWDGSKWIRKSPSTGAQGAQGHQGHQGAAGAQGAQGSGGTAGAQGAQGHQGHQGAAGAQGAQGNAGAQGAQGNAGAQGAQGHQGHQGLQGAQGAQGNAGAQGNQGSAGSATISTNADNRVITGGSGSNLVGESKLTFNPSTTQLTITRDDDSNSGYYVVHNDGSECARLVNKGSGHEGALLLQDGGSPTVYFDGETGSRSYINTGAGLAIGTQDLVSGRPDNVLHLHKSSGGTADGPTIYFTNSNTGVTGSDGFTVGINDTQSPYIWNRENTDLRFGTANTHRMTIDNDGILKLFNGGNTQDGTYYSSFTLNNTGSGTYTRIRFDRGGVARWGLTMNTDDKFCITNLYKGGSVSADDSSFLIENNNRVSINGKISARQYQCPNTLTEDYSISSSYNEMMIGPITINNGITLTVNTGARLVVL